MPDGPQQKEQDEIVSTWKGSGMQIPESMDLRRSPTMAVWLWRLQRSRCRTRSKTVYLAREKRPTCYPNSNYFVVEISSAQIEELGLQPVPLVLVNGNSPDETTRLRALWA